MQRGVTEPLLGPCGGNTKRGLRRTPNFWGTARLCIGFFLVLMTYFTAEFLLPLVLKEQGLGNIGFYSFTVLYISFATTCAPARMALRSMSPRRAIPYAATVYALYIGVAAIAASGALPSGVTGAMLIVASAFIGAASSILWCSQGHILTYYAPPRLLNAYVSAFFSLYAINGLIGPLIVNALLRYMDFGAIYAVECVFAFIGVLFLTGLPDPEPDGGTPTEPKLSILTSSQIIAVAKGELTRPLALMFENKQSLCIAAISFANGAGDYPFVAATLPQVAMSRLVDPDMGRQRAALALAFMGCGHITASIIYTPMADRLGNNTALVFVLFCFCIAASCSNLEASDCDYVLGVPFAYIAAVTLGMANLTCRAILQSLLSSLYTVEPAKGTALKEIAAAIGTMLGFIILPSLSVATSTALTLALYTSAIIPCLFNPALFQTRALTARRATK